MAACMSPLSVRLPNGSWQAVPCSKCAYCRGSRAGDWAFRLSQEQKCSVTAHFITLTYSSDALPLDAKGVPIFDKSHCQIFFKAIRNDMVRFNKSPSFSPAEVSRMASVPSAFRSGLPTSAGLPAFKYYFAAEYGGEFGRPHYHMIAFNIPEAVASNLQALWSRGIVHVGSVTPASIAYVTKYITGAVDDVRPQMRPLISKGLGSSYISHHRARHLSQNLFEVRHNGFTKRLPRYFRDKMGFSELSKQLHAIEAVAASDAAYLSEVARLSAVHPDPANHYDERVAFQASRLVANAKSKLA